MTAVLTERIPLVENEAGDLHLEGSRIFLEHLVEKFNECNSPEDIQRDYPHLNLADLYAVMTYYLRHRDEVDAYVERQHQRAREMEALAARYKPVKLIEKMKARLESKR
jgi:uncharacterized protein (DUF433 family)